MNHIQTQEDKKDARLLRQLLEKEVSKEQAKMIWTQLNKRKTNAKELETRF